MLRLSHVRAFVFAIIASFLTTPAVAIDLVGIASRENQPEPTVPGTTFQDCLRCPEMVVVPAGTFLMGDGDHRAARVGPSHEVRLGRAFAVGRFEVTYGQWKACVADGGCPGENQRESIGMFGKRRDGQTADLGPVTMVNWRDAKTYAAWLRRSTGKPYRLLSEAEWEYVARAGTTTQWFCGDDSSCLDGVAWYRANSGLRTHPVGSKRSNAFGLHDVHGNLWEWVQDCWNEDYRGAPSDGSAWTTNATGKPCSDFSHHVLRGGSWSSTAWTLRIANRFGQSHATSIFGVRVARDLALPMN